MNKHRVSAAGLVALIALALLLGLPALVARRGPAPVRARLVALAGESSGYRRAEGPATIEFPRDHGPHPEYQTEWWYYTGNLDSADGRHFGYQLTFFRRALQPPAKRQPRASDWAAEQVYMAHFALTDVAGRRYQAFERFSRGAADLAGAQAEPYQIWLDDWSAEQVEPGTVRLRASQQGLAIDLLLRDDKGPILHGDRGYSRKGADPGEASYYYSLTRLTTSGSVGAGGTAFSVTGLSWTDHEWSTSSLAADQVGWDWFSVQLDDGSELMVFQLRRQDGSLDPYSGGTLIDADGTAHHLASDKFEIRVEDTWRSPRTGAAYPSRWTVAVPSAGLSLDIEPYLADQELDVSYAYWEGAVRIRGRREGQAVTGNGYVELTGYAGSMGGQF